MAQNQFLVMILCAHVFSWCHNSNNNEVQIFALYSDTLLIFQCSNIYTIEYEFLLFCIQKKNIRYETFYPGFRSNFKGIIFEKHTERSSRHGNEVYFQTENMKKKPLDFV